MSIYDIEEPVVADARPTLEGRPRQSRGVDFGQLLRERRAAMTPEQREQDDAREAAREALEASTKPVKAQWVWTRFKDANPKNHETVVDREEARDIKMRIEPKGDGEILRFVGGPTGHEAYALDSEFAKLVVQPDWQEPERFHICAGTPGSWPTCSVATDDVAAFLDHERPLLMAAARGLPSIDRAATPLDRPTLMQTLEQAYSDRRAAIGKSGPSSVDDNMHQPKHTAGQLDGLQWLLEMLPGTSSEEMRSLFKAHLDRSAPDVSGNAPFPLDENEGRAYLKGLTQVLKWGQALVEGPADQVRAAAPETKAALSALMAPEILGSAADTERMRANLRLTQVYARSTEPRPGSPDLIITATWGKDHDRVVAPVLPMLAAAAEAHDSRNRSARWAGIPFEAEADSRLDNELLQPLKSLAAATDRFVMVALGDKPTASLPGIMVRPDGTMTIAKAFIQDPANRVRAADDTVPGHPVTTLAAMEQTLKGPARAERLDVTIITQGKTPAYDRKSYAVLPESHDHKVQVSYTKYEVGGQEHLDNEAHRPRQVLDLTRASPFNTPTRVDRVAFANEATGAPEWTTPMAIDQAGVLCNHIRNELRTNPEYAIAIAKLEPEIVVADSRAEAFVMAAAVDAVVAHRAQMIAVPSQMMDAFDTDRSSQLYIGDPKEVQEAVVRQFDARIKDLSNTLKLPMQEDESGLTADGDIRTRRYQTSSPAAISHPQARFAAVDLAILAEDATSGQHTVQFVRDGLSVKAQLQGTDISIPAQDALGTMLLRQPDGVIAQATMDDVKRAAARPGDMVTIDLAMPSRDWGRQVQGLKRAAQR